MKIVRLRNRLLLSAVIISIVMAIAVMSVITWLIRDQYLRYSESLLQKASSVVTDNLSAESNGILNASRQLATRKNLVSTIWYLAQYANSDLDPETLANTYIQLARETHDISLAAEASKIAIYDAKGNLVAFSISNDHGAQVGFVKQFPKPGYRVADLHFGEDIESRNLQTVDVLDGMHFTFPSALPAHEDTHYVIVDGKMAIVARVPITEETSAGNGQKGTARQLGLVVAVKFIDNTFVNKMTPLTDTDINVFTAQGLVTGSVPGYTLLIGPPGGNKQGNATPASHQVNQIDINGNGYYQRLIPFTADGQFVGGIAVLHSKAIVEKNIWEMIRVLWLIAFAGLAFLAPMSWYFANSIANPLTALSDIFRRVANSVQHSMVSEELKEKLGDLIKDKNSNGEIDDLTQSFIAMNDAINRQIKEISDMNASLEVTISERTAALAAKEFESRTLIENSPDTVARYDQNCIRIYANSALVRASGYKLAELLGKTPSQIPGGANAELYESKLREVLESGTTAQFELKWEGRNGVQHCGHIRMTPETDASGNVVTVLAIGRDISDRLEFEETIWKQANFDDLTGLPNRQLFYDRLDHESKVAQRTGRSMALILIDLDHFKEVNDTLGHDQGDLLLIEAARRLVACVRETDTVARLGGDEYTVILSNLDDLQHIDRIAQNIIANLSQPFSLNDTEVFVSASLGVTVYPGDATELDQLFKNADQAMYASKKSGRNRTSYFTKSLQEQALARLQLTNDLRVAIREQQFLVYFQPIVDLSNGKIYKAEALIRWPHPQRGMISPVEFIPVAEDAGLISVIGDWVFKNVVETCLRWREQFDASFQISINKSPLQLRYDGEALLSWPIYLKERGLTGQAIAVEITEGLLLHAEEAINKKLLSFHDAGIQLAIDDFGTGYSSLSYVKRFDIDFLKIDRSFVQNLENDADNLAFCEAIILMAHKLGLKVIAEGVETEQQRDLLISMRCDFAQGFFYSPALPADQFEQFLGSQTSHQ